MFPECELGPSKGWLLASCFFPFQTVVYLSFDNRADIFSHKSWSRGKQKLIGLANVLSLDT
jgi:hypothetical protein